MSIICGTDLSEASFEALRVAVAIAARRGDPEVHLVHALDAAGAHDDDAREVLVGAATRRVEAEAARATAGTQVKIRTDVVVGPAVSTLLDLAATEGSELVVIGSKGYTNSPVYRLGGTTERIVQASPLPVLVVRDPGPFTAWAHNDRALRVMVGVDESAGCDAAIRFAKQLRSVGPADLVVGNVYYADEAARRYGVKVANLVDANPELEKLLARDLSRRFGEVGGEGALVVRPRRGLGRIGDHLLELADAETVDLIVIGTRQKAGLGRLSSVSSVVLHDARQSVLCIPSASVAPEQVPRFKIAVVATDLSDFGNRAVPYAYGLVGDAGEVHLVHVVDEDEDHDVVGLTTRLSALTPSGAKAATITHVVPGDDAAQCIGETAERVGADVVCIASHGRSGLSRALMGSVADKLLRACRRPVLVLRPPTH